MTPSRTVSPEEVAVNSGFNGMHPGHHGDAGRMTGWGGAVGVGKGDRLPGEAIEVGRDDSGMLGEGRDVVVEVVDRDEEDMGLGLLSQGSC